MEKTLPEIYAVVVNWNRKEDTIACLGWLSNQVGVIVHIVVVDNGSIDDPNPAIALSFPTAHFIKLAKNLGFAGGYNAGIRWAIDQGAEYIFIVNNDTLADKNLLLSLITNFREGVGIVGPAIFLAASPNELWSQGGHIDPILLEARDDHGRKKQLPLLPEERDFLSGCAMLIKREVFDQVGIFDERFFLYYEDMDFCLRVIKKGFHLLIVPQARLYHRVSQSSGGSNSPQERYFMAYSSAVYFKKHMRLWQMPLILIYRFTSAILWTLRLLIHNKIKSIIAYWKGLFNGWIRGTNLL